MMCQNYETVVLPHRTTADLDPTLFGGFEYNTYPGDFAESVTDIKALYVIGDELIVVAVTSQIYWPGYGAVRLRFNAVTGEFISREDISVSVGFLWTGDITQSVGNRLYITQLALVYRCDANYVVDGDAIDPATYGLSSFGVYFFDESRDRAIVHDPIFHLSVYSFVTGTLIHTLRLPEAPIQIVHDQGTRVFVLLANKAVLSLDYATGQTYSYVRIPQIDNATNARLAWNPAYRRMLICELVPDNVDGTSATNVRGFRYVDIPVHVCKPIPLTRLRDGVRSPVLVKQVGDLGEGIAGLATLTSDEVAAVVTRGHVPLDGDGEGRGEMLGTAEGDETLTATVEAACLL